MRKSLFESLLNLILISIFFTHLSEIELIAGEFTCRVIPQNTLQIKALEQASNIQQKNSIDQTRVEHPDYIITLDKWGTQTSIEEGPRIKAAREQARRAEERARKAQKAASNLMARYKKQIEQELLNQALKAVTLQPAVISKKGTPSSLKLTNQPTTNASVLLTQSQKSMAQAKSALAQAESQIKNAKTQSAKAQAEAAKKAAETQIAIAQKKMEEAKKALSGASAKELRSSATRATSALTAKQSLDRVLASSRSLSSPKASIGDPFSKIDISKFKITFKGNTAQIKDANGNVLAEAKTQGKTVKINNNITGSKVDMSYGRFGLESLKEVNKTGKEVRTESYNYKVDRTGRVKELNYLIKDTEPTSIQTSQGTKSVIASGAKQSLYEASGTIKYDGKGRVTSSEENKTLKNNKKTIYSFHESLTGVQYDRLNQMVSFEKQTSEKGLGIKKYSTTITRAGEVDSTGKLSHYIENERTKQGKVKISRTYEATPTYQGDKLLSENRTLIAEKIKQTSSFFSKALSFLPTLVSIFAPVLAPALQVWQVAALASATTFATGLATGQGFKQALLGAAISLGTAVVAAGVRGVADAALTGSKTISSAFTSALTQKVGTTSMESAVMRLATTSITNTFGEKLGPVGSSVLGGALGTITSSRPDMIALGAVKGLASGYISKALGNSTGAQFATAALGGLSDSVIDNSYKSYLNNMNAIKQAPQGAKLEREGLYVTGATQTTSDGKISHYTFDGKEFKYQYTEPANAELITKISNTFTGVSFAPTTKITGSKTHINGLTTYYDKQGNFTSALPDNQIPVYDKDGKQIATQLPISMMTLGMGSNLYFSPVSEGDKTLHAMGYVPVGATPVIKSNTLQESVTILSNGDRIIFNAQGQTEAFIPYGAEEYRNGEGRVVGSFLKDQDGSFTYLDNDGVQSYTITNDGEIRLYDLFKPEVAEFVVPAGATAIVNDNGDVQSSFKRDGLTLTLFDPQGKETNIFSVEPLIDEFKKMGNAVAITFKDAARELPVQMMDQAVQHYYKEPPKPISGSGWSFADETILGADYSRPSQQPISLKVARTIGVEAYNEDSSIGGYVIRNQEGYHFIDTKTGADRLMNEEGLLPVRVRDVTNNNAQIAGYTRTFVNGKYEFYSTRGKLLHYGQYNEKEANERLNNFIHNQRYQTSNEMKWQAAVENGSFSRIDAYKGADGSGKYTYIGNFLERDPRKQNITAVHGIASPKEEVLGTNGMPFQSYLYGEKVGIDANLSGWAWNGGDHEWEYYKGVANANDTALSLANYKTEEYLAESMQKALLFAPPVAEARNFEAHSMGARQTLGSIEILRQRGIPVGAVVLMDPAVDYNSLLGPRMGITYIGPEYQEYKYKIPEGEFYKAADWAEKVVVYHHEKDKAWGAYNVAQGLEWIPLTSYFPGEYSLGAVGIKGYERKDYPSSVDVKNVSKGKSEIPGAWIEDHGDYFRASEEQVGEIWRYSKINALDKVRGYRLLRSNDEN